MVRSILSVITGIVIWGVLWVAANAVVAEAASGRFNENGITTDPALLVLFMSISAALSVLAGWLCAAIAGRSIMRHVLMLALIQLAIGIGMQASVWDQMPVWYHVSFLALVVPMHLAGGRLRAMRGDRPSQRQVAAA